MPLFAVTHIAAGGKVIPCGSAACFLGHNMVKRNLFEVVAAYITARTPFFYDAFPEFMFSFFFCP